MDKMILKDDCGNWSLAGVRWNDIRPGSRITKDVDSKLYAALWKLMEYEESELDPDEVDRMVIDNNELILYLNIGTVEECREAVEKQIPKRSQEVDDDYGYFKCPSCGELIYASYDLGSHKYCLNCGQAIKWEAEKIE